MSRLPDLHPLPNAATATHTIFAFAVSSCVFNQAASTRLLTSAISSCEQRFSERVQLLRDLCYVHRSSALQVTYTPVTSWGDSTNEVEVSRDVKMAAVDRVAEPQDERHAQQRIGTAKCQTCSIEPSKYRCPRCSALSCRCAAEPHWATHD